MRKHQWKQPDSSSSREKILKTGSVSILSFHSYDYNITSFARFNANNVSVSSFIKNAQK